MAANVCNWVPPPPLKIAEVLCGRPLRLFHDINLKNKGVIVIPRFCTVCGSVRTSFGDIGEKFTGLDSIGKY